MDSLTADQRLCWSSTGVATVESGASKIILKTNDVVFTKIAAALYFNEDQIVVGRVFYPVCNTDGNVDRFASANGNLTAVECDFRRAANHVPVFRPLRMLL